MAAPVVSGLISLMLQKKNNLTTVEARSILRKSAVRDGWTGPGPWDSEYGYGKLSVERALIALRAL